ncbi:MAG: M20/M25/M40 family metallo-hydrolase [Flavobacteriaceae bacterium]|nr:M20/M25/M40 family metallo-hydrolase [Flavobacteriaceae bacterium]MCY4217536.1 M20/M25/M40 family metallo-hydrolase [Flavobacteriaceae bacterium]MCY4254117.1 M20/M25/M40 family metallo-hydrolase [Flavobacteriaceae bacterium]
MRRIFIIAILVFLSSSVLYGQKTVENQIKKIYELALTQGKSYQWLDHLANRIGGRLSGSLNSELSIQWAEEQLLEMGYDQIWFQDVMVPKWVRGNYEYASFETQPGSSISVDVCALGGSIGTSIFGLEAPVVEVKSFEELENLGQQNVEGKFVFYNKPMPPERISPLDAYRATVQHRTQGAYRAAKLGAVGTIVRSLTMTQDDFPHTGNMSYQDLANRDRIPATAISTNGANLLSSMLKLNPDLVFYLKQNCKNYPEVLSHNIIVEVKGSEYPDQIIVFGGHLDSWDLGDGAHDDGAGVVQSMDVLHLFQLLDYKPKRTLRLVLWTNEENGLKGARTYAQEAREKDENHIFAIESDAGGFSPRGFTFEATDEQFEKLQSWQSYFYPYYADRFVRDGSSPDVVPLRNGTTVLAGLRPDLQRYFEFHHAANDTFDKVNKRELALGAATLASIVYLVDQFGI